MGTVRAKLDQARKDLLDLGLRNTLLNYQTLKSRGVEIIDELADEVYRILVSDERRMSFLAAPEDALEEAVAEESDVGDVLLAALAEQPEDETENEEDGVAARHRDTKLQTPHSSARLQRRLLNTFYAARSSIEEQGVNTLYLAVGMLCWYEAPSSDTRRRAPLILVPVQLERTNVRQNFRLRYTGEEIGPNLSLEAKLKQEFGIELPGFDVPEDLVPSEYFREVEKEVSTKPRWEVDDSAIALGFFSFSKFLMYKDLDPEIWGEDGSPTDDPIIRALLQDGFRETGLSIGDEERLDDHVKPEDIYQIRDADSSQTLAILDALDGKNLVIQGPPGTGKSQTIANLIAEALARDKTVLFVAEKMAALEVVKRRLDEDGIGDACLELHSHKTNKKALLEELKRTLELGKPRLPGGAQTASELEQRRDQLNAYADAVNTPISGTGVTPYQTFGRLLRFSKRLEGSDYPRIELDETTLEWGSEGFRQRQQTLEELEALLRRMGVPAQHPFWGAEVRAFLPKDQSNLRDLADTTLRQLEAVRIAGNELLDTIGLGEDHSPDSLEGLDRWVAAAKRLASRPPLSGVSIDDDGWRTQAESIRETTQRGVRFRELHDEHGETLLPEAWDADVLEVRQALAAYGTKWWRWLSGRYRRAVADLRGLCSRDLPKPADQRLALVDAILEAKRIEKEVENRADRLAELFGNEWSGIDSDWSRLDDIASWLTDVHAEIKRREIPEAILDGARNEFSADELRSAKHTLSETREAFLKTIGELRDLLRINEEIGAPEKTQLDEHESRLQDWRARSGEVHDIIAFNQFGDRLDEQGLSDWVPVAATWDAATDRSADLFGFAWFNVLAGRALGERKPLARFHGQSHSKVLESFRDLDTELLKINRARVALKHYEGLPRRAAGGQLGVLLREFEKKRRHLPIRQLTTQAGNAIQRIKPVFMMSPLSIATYIPPESVEFDLVIFDEASQVRPVDAFGALLRGGQAIVVGDSRQLPPTTFFEKMFEPGEDEEEVVVAADMESILGLFSAQGAPERMLRWHYRSRHESLIAVSNHEFYDNKLVTFPSPDSTREELGVKFHPLPDTTYEPGKKRYNRGEAEAVAKAVMRHARERPHLTLGVAAFSQAQAQVVQDLVELERRQDPSLEKSFFSAHTEEPFFVKNLENVQGDERDVIYISVGYGKREDGYLSHNFGPLNRDGGERRLNVLITRARLRCEVFSNFTGDDIDLARSNARGVVAFKRYLKFAESGSLDLPRGTGRDPDSPFEVVVAEDIRGLGYKVVHQVGSGGFFVDLAVVDPEQPGRYLLGIECDGAAYHSARWARDRDRLRQQVLEGLGWHIHRIWSTDWFRNPEGELRRVAEALEAAKTAPKALRPKDEETDPRSSDGTKSSGIARDPVQPNLSGDQLDGLGGQAYTVADVSDIEYQLIEKQLHEVEEPSMAEWVRQVAKEEGPVHKDIVAQRIVEGAGLNRRGSRIVDAVERGIDYAAQQNMLRRKGDYVWAKGDGAIAPRDRSDRPMSERKIELVPPQEIAAAVHKVVEASLGIGREDAIREAARLLGYQRLSEAIATGIDGVVSNMLADAKLETRGDFLVVPEP